MDSAIIRRVQEWLTAATCSEADCAGGILQLAFGTHRLVIQSCWRLSHDDITIASGSPDCDAVRAALISSRVRRIEVQNDYHDLLVEFEDGARLETFADAVDHEHWNVTGESDGMVVAGPGRLWSSF